MKVFTNKSLIAFFLACGLAACGDTVSSSVETTVEEPATVEQKQEVKKEVTPIPVKKEKMEIVSQAPAVTAKPVKTFSSEELANELKKWDKKLEFLTTSFKQTTSFDGVLISQSQGTLSYDKGNNFLRLDTLDNQGTLEQSAVTDKKEIIILDNLGKQVTTLSWADWQEGQPNQALYDFGNYTALVNRHQVTVESQTDDEAVILLTPKGGEEYKLYLTLNKADFFPKTIAIESDLMLTRAELTNIRKNQALAAEIFGGFFK